MNSRQTPSRNSTFTPILLGLLLAICCIPLAGTASADAPEATPANPEQALRSWFGGVEMAEAIQVGPLTVIPLMRAEVVKDDTTVISRSLSIKATVKTVKRKSAILTLENTGKFAVFIPAARIARDEKAGNDYVIAHDVIVAPGATLDVRALPSAFKRGSAAAGQELTLTRHCAPPSLREEIVDDASSYDIKTFLALFREVVGDDDDKIPSLYDVLESDFARALDEEIAAVSKEPVWQKTGLVGFATGVFGRITSLQTFATPRLTREMMATTLQANGIRAAALCTRQEDLGIPIARETAARDRVVDATRDALAHIAKRAQLRSDDKAQIEFRAGSASGQGIWHGGHLLHVAVYPHDPYERVLFRRTFESLELDKPDGENADDRVESESQAELERKARRGTETEYERRLRERRSRLRGGR